MKALHFLFCALAIGNLWFAAAPSVAGTITVTSPGDDGPGTLRDAIINSAPGGTIVFALPAGTLILLTSGELMIGRDLVIAGPAGANLVVNGNMNSRVFNILAGNVTISGLDIANGSAVGLPGTNQFQDGGDGLGGGILVTNGASLSLLNCSISGNQAIGGTSQSGLRGSGYGGGIYNLGSLTLNGCTLAANTAVTADQSFDKFGGGGAIANLGLIRLTNCTITGNSAQGSPANELDAPLEVSSFGGGIYNEGSGSMTSCTISGNHSVSPGRGGGFYNEDPPNAGLVVLQNNIIAGNVADEALDVHGGPGAFISSGFNLIGSTNGSYAMDWRPADLLGNDSTPLGANLGPPKDNGGPTQTMAPNPGSAAIGAGNGFGLNQDQRGFFRVPGKGCDIGAFEGPHLGLALAVIQGEQAAVSWDRLSAAYHAPLNTGNGKYSGTVLQVLSQAYGSQFQEADDSHWVTVSHTPQITDSQFVMYDHIQTNISLLYRLFGPAVYPPTVTNFDATDIQNTTASLNGVAAANDSDTTVWFNLGTDTNYTLGIVSAGTVSGTDTNLESVSGSANGLNPGILYHYQLAALNSGGVSYGDDLTFTTSNTVSPIVVTLAVTGVTSTSATFHGTINPEGMTTLQAYFAYDNDSNGNFGFSATQSVGSGTNPVPFSATVTGLSPGTSYDFNATASNSLGIYFPGNSLRFVTATPANPLLPPSLQSPGTTSDSGYTTSDNNPVFIWGQANGAASYGLYISQSGNPNPIFSVTGLTGSNYFNTNSILQASTKYSWTMVSFDGTGNQSAAASPLYFQTQGTPPPPPPPMAPIVQDGPAVKITSGSATLQGFVNPNGSATTAYFDWGQTAYTNQTPYTNLSATHEISATISNLARYTSYMYRVHAFNAGGAALGADTNFTTSFR